MTAAVLEVRHGDLVRNLDVSGVSGTGTVAQIVQLANGKFVLAWVGDHPSTTIWDDLDGILAVHGHDGATVIRWADGEVQVRAGEDEPCQGL